MGFIEFEPFVQMQEETYLYDPKLIAQLDFSQSPVTFEPSITALSPGEPWLKVRPLKDTDYDRGFLQLLSQLTQVGAVTRTQFLSKISKIYPHKSFSNCVLPAPAPFWVICSTFLPNEGK